MGYARFSCNGTARKWQIVLVQAHVRGRFDCGADALDDRVEGFRESKRFRRASASPPQQLAYSFLLMMLALLLEATAVRRSSTWQPRTTPFRWHRSEPRFLAQVFRAHGFV